MCESKLNPAAEAAAEAEAAKIEELILTALANLPVSPPDHVVENLREKLRR